MEEHWKKKNAAKLLGYFFLSKLREFEEKEILSKFKNGNLNSKEVLINECSKEIIKPKGRLSHLFKKNLDSKKNELLFFEELKENKRNLNLIFLSLMEFKGLNHYMEYEKILQDDIRKMSYYIKHKHFKEGEYIYRYGDYSNALYGVIDGIVEGRIIDFIDYTKKIQFESFNEDKFKENEVKNDNNDYENDNDEEKIPFEYFMSDIEDYSDSDKENNDENYDKENDKNVNNYREYINKINEVKITYSNYIDNDDEKNNKNNNININNNNNNINKDNIKLKLINKRLKIKNIKKDFKKILTTKNIKRKKVKNIIKAIKKHQTPEGELTGKKLNNFISEFEKYKTEYKNGMCFGDYSVIYSFPRLTSVICKSDVDVFYLEKKYVEKILSNRFLKSDLKKIEFLSKIIPSFDINIRIFSKITPIFCDKDKIIYTPYDEIKYIYIIYKGECSFGELNIQTNSKEEYLSLFYNIKKFSILGIGGICGLEISKGNKFYDYSLIVMKQNTILFKIDINLFKKYCHDYMKVFEKLYDKRIEVQKVLNENKSFIEKNSKRGLSEKIRKFENEMRKTKINVNKRKFTVDKLKICITELNPNKKLISIKSFINTKSRNEKLKQINNNISYVKKYQTSLNLYKKNIKRNNTPNLCRVNLKRKENNLPTLNNINSTSIIQTNDKTFSENYQKNILNKSNINKSLMNKTINIGINTDKELFLKKTKKNKLKVYDLIKHNIIKNNFECSNVNYYNSGCFNIPLVSS